MHAGGGVRARPTDGSSRPAWGQRASSVHVVVGAACLWAWGRTLPWGQAGRGALPADARLGAFAARLGLTPREAQVCRYLVRGRSLPYIAEQLYVTAGTVKTHALHIYRKAGVSSKQDLISLYSQC